MQYQQPLQGRSNMNSMNKASSCMFLPGMAPSANGAKISIKPRTNWSDRNRLQSSQRPNGLEKPVAKKVEPYRGWRDQQLKNIPSVDVDVVLVLQCLGNLAIGFGSYWSRVEKIQVQRIRNVSSTVT